MIYTPWDKELEKFESRGFRIVPLGENMQATHVIDSFSRKSMPQCIRIFAELWSQCEDTPWQIILKSTESDLFPGTETPLPIFTTLRSLVDRAKDAALVWDERGKWHSPEQWGYLLRLYPHDRQETTATLLLHPPILSSEISMAEEIINTQLPDSYKALLQISNGLGIGAWEYSSLYGVGPQRVDWRVVVDGTWLACQHAHEITAAWRFFTGIYADLQTSERVRCIIDNASFLPFASTYDSWLMNTSQAKTSGEYAIAIWDHEVCEEFNMFDSLSEWIEGEFEPYLFGEE